MQNQNMNEQVNSDYKPISMWGYFGYELLFGIPLVGFICLLVFSFGGTSNVNLKNFARSHFCWFIIGVILSVVIVALVVGGIGIGGGLHDLLGELDSLL